MTKILGALVGIVGVFWLAIVGGAGVYWWDRRPHNTPSIHVMFFNWSPPDSWKARALAAEDGEKRAEDNAQKLSTALDKQNAAIKALGQASADDHAKAEHAVAQARTSMVHALSAQMKIQVAGSKLQDVDAAFLETLK